MATKPPKAVTTSQNGGQNPVEQTAGISIPGDGQDPITPGELGYPLGGNPWRILGFEDPSVMMTLRDVELEDLHNMTKRDGHARALLNVLSWPLRAAKRVIDPDEDGEVERDFIEDMLTRPPYRGGMTTTMNYVLASHALAFRDGFKCFEKVVQIRQDDQGRYLQVLRKLMPLPSDSIAFRYDEHGGFDGLVQTIYWDGQKRVVPMPSEKVLLYTVNKEESPLEGESLFLPAYYHYDKKHRLYYIAHIAAQMGAVSMRYAITNAQDRKVRDEMLRALTNMALNGAAIFPTGTEIGFITSGEVLGHIIALIEHHDVSMSKSILAHFLDVGTEGKGGLGTATTTSELGDLFVVALESHLQDIAEGITAYVIPYFIDVNFGTGRYPVFRFEPFTDEQKVAIAAVFTAMLSKESVAPQMWFEIQKRMGEELGLEGIDWEALQVAFDQEQQLRDELKKLTLQASAEGIKNPPPAPAPGGAAGGGGGPTPPAPRPAPTLPQISLDEETARLEVQRRLQLAESALRGQSVVDRYGRGIVVGDRVTFDDDEHLYVGSGGASRPIWHVTEILGGTLILMADSGEQDYQPGPLARAANTVEYLG